MTESLASQPTLLDLPVRTCCSHCGQRFDGSLEDGRAWFKDHLASRHPTVRVTERRPRPPIHRVGPPSLARSA
jgi:hypothetical protein